MGKNYDFSGWATKNDLECSDGRVIRKDAFKHNDGQIVPLVWNHKHDRPEEVLGHALLENRDEGVYAYGTFNDTPSGQNAKLLVQHGDVDRLSIYANRLKHQGRDVIHGAIREVSLVLAGANPGAYIDTVMMHGDDSYEEGWIRSGDFIENVDTLIHEDKEDEEKGADTEVSEEKKETEIKEEKKSEKTVKEIIEAMTEEQKKAVYIVVAQAIEDTKNSSDKDVKHSDDENDEDLEDEEKSEELDDSENDDENEKDEDVEGGNDDMKHNVFDSETNNKEVLTHSEMAAIFSDAKKRGSLADAVLEHGIEEIDVLFPDAQSLEKTPGFIKRDDSWVAEFMKLIHHTPFSRIKSIFADITEAEARAKGYIKGNVKTEEFFSLLKRTTTPTTIYKKQKLDRDDILDITDFDIVAWLKAEMRMMLEEEIARAILVGDGRNSSSDDKINEQNVRPIWTDEDLYTYKQLVQVTDGMTDDDKAKAFIKGTIKSRKHYKGSGNPIMYADEDIITNCLLLEDMNGRIIYDSMDKLATALRVKKIVTVPVMEGLKRTVGSNTHTLGGIYVNPADYNVGADKGGAVNMFDDFDIDYNQQKYLIETRISGALTKPYAAVAVEFVEATVEG